MQWKPVMAALLGSLLTLGPGMARAGTSFPIDDFEVVGFDYWVDDIGLFTWVQPIPPPQTGHVISPSRKVQIYHGPETPIAGKPIVTLDAGSQADDRLYFDLWDDTFLVLEYELSLAGLDLTAGGDFDRIEMEISPAGADSPIDHVSVDLEIVDIHGMSHVEERLALADYEAELLSWPLGEFSGIDLTNVVRIRFHFETTARKRKFVGDIRLRGAWARPTTFVESVTFTQAPPYPTPPLRIDVLDSATRGGLGTLYEFQAAVPEASAGFVPALALEWASTPTYGGMVGEASLLWVDALPFQAANVELTIDFVPEGLRLLSLYPPDPIHGTHGVLLPLQMVITEGRWGPEIAMSEAWITLDVHPSQPLEIANVSITENLSPPALITGVTVHATLIPTGDVDETTPLLTMSFLADVTPTSTSGVPDGSAAPVAALRLEPHPAVTRGGTVIRSSRAFGGDADLHVHDAAGRLVRTLPVAAGALEVHWDGNNRDGRPATAGVYFIRVATAGPATAVARVVKVE